MAEVEAERVAPTMSSEEAESYRLELKAEIAELVLAQSERYSKYKEDRIKRLSHRLGIPVD